MTPTLSRSLRAFSTPLNSRPQKQLFEREIRTSLAKLERLAALIPAEDAKKQRAYHDLNSLNTQFGELMMKDQDETMENEAEIEMKVKKLMTVARSKYYMLKVNYPKFAETIDSEATPSFDAEEYQS